VIFFGNSDDFIYGLTPFWVVRVENTRLCSHSIVRLEFSGRLCKGISRDGVRGDAILIRIEAMTLLWKRS